MEKGLDVWVLGNLRVGRPSPSLFFLVTRKRDASFFHAREERGRGSLGGMRKFFTLRGEAWDFISHGV